MQGELYPGSCLHCFQLFTKGEILLIAQKVLAPSTGMAYLVVVGMCP